MPRRPRVLLPGFPLHIIQRGNNRSACFFSEGDCQFYIDTLAALAHMHNCEVHAWCLMTNHVHILLTPSCVLGTALLMKGLGQRYVQYVNRTYRRTGTLWEGRFRSCLVQQESYLLACYRYIELNPVRAGMVEHPADYRWSSYKVNALEEASNLVTPHSIYNELGRDALERAKAYQGLFKSQLAPAVIDHIRTSTNGNYVLGGIKFASKISHALGKRVIRGVAGRPKAVFS